MRPGALVAALTACAVVGTRGVTLVERRDGLQPRTVEHGIQRRPYGGNPVERDRRRMRLRKAKRSGTVTENLDNEETLYFMNVTIGTPAQSLRLHVDTGSSDLWVNTASSSECSQRNSLCSQAGTYSANSSSTYEYVNSDFSITYTDGSGASGDYVTDVVRLGDGDTVDLDGQQFGIGYTSSSQQGILGIGYAVNEVAYQTTGRTYSNVPQTLVSKGFTAANAYSLWLNDLDASTGSILFGGVNTGKYTGTLETLPIIKEGGGYAEFIIALTAVGANGETGNIVNDTAIPVLLDSGSSLTYLPDDITQVIYNATGAQYDSSEGVAIVPCGLANLRGTLEFTFSSPTISVGLDELVIVAGEANGREVCILGVCPAGSSIPVLGDTFLRSAYVVYDLDNNEISLAQTDFNSTDNNVLEITSGGSVPSATAVANAVSTAAAVATGGARNVGQPTGLTSGNAAAPTGPVGYNMAVLGAAGAAALFAL